MDKCTVLDFAQHLDDGSPNPDWLAARIGRVTGTSADAMLAQGRTKGQESTQRRNLRIRLALERLTERSLERDFQTQEMAQGLAREAYALGAYEERTDRLIYTCGFIRHDEMLAGCSIDGYYGDFEGLVSVKCPDLAKHADAVHGGKIDLGYMRQIQHEQWITGAAWTDYVSYNPDFPEKLQLVILRVPRNDDAMAQHEAELRRFLAEVETEYRALKLMAEGFAGALAS